MPCSVWSCGTLCCAARWCSRRPDQNFFTRPGQIRPDDQTRWMDGGTPPGGTTTRRIRCSLPSRVQVFFLVSCLAAFAIISPSTHAPRPVVFPFSAAHSPPSLCGSVALWCVLCFNTSSYQRPLPFFSLLLHPQAPPTRHPRFPGDDVSLRSSTILRFSSRVQSFKLILLHRLDREFVGVLAAQGDKCTLTTDRCLRRNPDP